MAAILGVYLEETPLAARVNTVARQKREE